MFNSLRGRRGPKESVGVADTEAMTLTEVVVSLAIGGLLFGGILRAYMQATVRAEWSAYSFAANSLALQRLEQARAAKWDSQSSPPVDRLVASNFPMTVDLLDVPISGRNATYATSSVVITSISVSPPLKLIQVETIWPFLHQQRFTNSLLTYRSPDQ